MRVLTINELLRLTRKGTLRPRGTHCRRPSALSRGIGGTHRRTDQPAQHSLGAGAARTDAKLRFITAPLARRRPAVNRRTW